MRMRGWSLLFGGGVKAGAVKVVLVASSLGGFVIGQQLGHGALGAHVAPPSPVQAAVSGHIATVPHAPATPTPSPTPTPIPAPTIPVNVPAAPARVPAAARPTNSAAPAPVRVSQPAHP